MNTAFPYPSWSFQHPLSLTSIMSQAIHSFSLTSKDATSIVPRALALLRPHLPTALPLFRRLQFGRFFDATCLLSNIDLSTNQEVPPPPWALAFVDRSCRPETEVRLPRIRILINTTSDIQRVQRDQTIAMLRATLVPKLEI